ncbi:MAG: 50S ribosomal protein L1, partial [Lacipirellulaceae bacterium]
MPKLAKRMKSSAAKRPEAALPVSDAVEALQKYDGTKFDQTVEVVLRLGVDHTQADQIVRGSIVLPNGIGKELRVVVFAKGAAADAAREAGADEVGPAAEDLLGEIVVTHFV